MKDRLKEIQNPSHVLDMVVLNLLEVPSIILILNCLADSGIQIKKSLHYIVIRKYLDDIDQVNKAQCN